MPTFIRTTHTATETITEEVTEVHPLVDLPSLAVYGEQKGEVLRALLFFLDTPASAGCQVTVSQTTEGDHAFLVDSDLNISSLASLVQDMLGAVGPNTLHYTVSF